jgi:hypothetical protein
MRSPFSDAVQLNIVNSGSPFPFVTGNGEHQIELFRHASLVRHSHKQNQSEIVSYWLTVSSRNAVTRRALLAWSLRPLLDTDCGISFLERGMAFLDDWRKA